MTFEEMRPMLMVSDLQQTLAFYADVLGFEVTATYPEGDRPTWAAASVGNVRLMFSWVGEPHTHEDGETHSHEPEFNGALYFTAAGDIRELHARVRSRVPSCGDIDEQPWGMTEFSVQDPNGYELIFGKPTNE